MLHHLTDIVRRKARLRVDRRLPATTRCVPESLCSDRVRVELVWRLDGCIIRHTDADRHSLQERDESLLWVSDALTFAGAALRPIDAVTRLASLDCGNAVFWAFAERSSRRAWRRSGRRVKKALAAAGIPVEVTAKLAPLVPAASAGRGPAASPVGFLTADLSDWATAALHKELSDVLAAAAHFISRLAGGAAASVGHATGSLKVAVIRFFGHDDDQDTDGDEAGGTSRPWRPHGPRGGLPTLGIRADNRSSEELAVTTSRTDYLCLQKLSHAVLCRMSPRLHGIMLALMAVPGISRDKPSMVTEGAHLSDDAPLNAVSVAALSVGVSGPAEGGVIIRLRLAGRERHGSDVPIESLPRADAERWRDNSPESLEKGDDGYASSAA